MVGTTRYRTQSRVTQHSGPFCFNALYTMTLIIETCKSVLLKIQLSHSLTSRPLIPGASFQPLSRVHFARVQTKPARMNCLMVERSTPSIMAPYRHVQPVITAYI